MNRQNTLTVTGQVLKVAEKDNRVLLRLSGLLDDSDEGWILFPQKLPDYVLAGGVFQAQLNESVETFEQLAQTPLALSDFSRSPSLDMSTEELMEKLKDSFMYKETN